MPYVRPLLHSLQAALRVQPRFMQVLQGPRQVGKTTLAEQIAAQWKGPVSLVAADSAIPPAPGWVQPRWQALAAQSRPSKPGLLILDEIQKVPRWSEEVKALWDAERRAARGLRVLLLGSSSLLVQKGLSESLAGRFQLHQCQHWPWAECHSAFKMGLDEWIYYGGYPGAAALRKRPAEWASYVNASLIESVLSKDILQLQAVQKPALLRQLFGLAAGYPAQIVSYTKMLGQLNDAGNTTTLAHYLNLLQGAFLVSGLQPFRLGQSVQRGGKPKLVVWNNALINALSGRSLGQAKADSAWWGHLVENAVGAHLLQGLPGSTHRLYQTLSPGRDHAHWRRRDQAGRFLCPGPLGVVLTQADAGRLFCYPFWPMPTAFSSLQQTLKRRPLLMGVLNVTPDSFSDGGRWLDPRAALAHAEALYAAGADLVDLGGESTRPGAPSVSLEEELARVLPVAQGLKGRAWSIDTQKAEVARQAVQAGACLINDVSALTADPAMLSTAAASGAAVCLMHRLEPPVGAKWSPDETTRYGSEGVVAAVMAYLQARIDACRAAGIPADCIWVDPGLGFGKTVADNLTLLKMLPRFIELGHPILVGPSRKSFLGAVLGGLGVDERLEATLAAGSLALWQGASILRAHDIKEIHRAAQVVQAIKLS